MLLKKNSGQVSMFSLKKQEEISEKKSSVEEELEKSDEDKIANEEKGEGEGEGEEEEEDDDEEEEDEEGEEQEESFTDDIFIRQPQNNENEEEDIIPNEKVNLVEYDLFYKEQYLKNDVFKYDVENIKDIETEKINKEMNKLDIKRKLIEKKKLKDVMELNGVDTKKLQEEINDLNEKYKDIKKEKKENHLKKKKTKIKL